MMRSKDWRTPNKTFTVSNYAIKGLLDTEQNLHVSNDAIKGLVDAEQNLQRK